MDSKSSNITSVYIITKECSGKLSDNDNENYDKYDRMIHYIKMQFENHNIYIYIYTLIKA